MKNPNKVEPIGTGQRPEDRPPTRVYENVADLVADPDNPTPMVRLSRRFTGLDGFEIFVKLERNNPFGSIKDRTALYLLNGLDIREGQVLAEPTAGNTGIALAALANAQGTPIEIAIPEGVPEEKKALLRFLGVELISLRNHSLVSTSVQGSQPAGEGLHGDAMMLHHIFQFHDRIFQASVDAVVPDPLAQHPGQIRDPDRPRCRRVRGLVALPSQQGLHLRPGIELQRSLRIAHSL